MLETAADEELANPFANVRVERTTVGDVGSSNQAVGNRLLMAQVLLDPLLPLILQTCDA